MRLSGVRPELVELALKPLCSGSGEPFPFFWTTTFQTTSGGRDLNPRPLKRRFTLSSLLIKGNLRFPSLTPR